MPLLSIPVNVPTTIPQNVVHALPARLSTVISTVALEVSQSQGGPWTAAPDSLTGMESANSFVRCPSASALVTAKLVRESAYRNRVLFDGAVAYWRLGETSGTVARDTVGGYNGLIGGGITLNQPGPVSGNKAMLFDGVVGTGIALSGNFSTLPPLTIEAWIKSSVNGKPFIADSSPNGFHIGINSSKAWLYLNAAANSITGTKTIDDNQWHHIAMVLLATGVYIYVDGVIDFSAPGATYPGSATDTLAIGYGPVHGNNWNGLLDEISIYRKALTPEQIASHYALGSPPPITNYRDQVIADGAVAYWRLGETSGTTVASEVGGYTGTVSGGVTLGQPGALADGNTAMAFDGVNDYINIPLGAYSAFGTGPLTMECWFKTTLVQSFKRVLDFKNNGDSAARGVGFLTGGAGQLYLEYCTGSTLNAIGGAVTYADSAWHHLVAVVTRGTTDNGYLFVDGVQRATAAIPTALSLTSTVPAGIGSAQNGINPIQGLIDEVAIYHTALTPAQIANHYALRSSSI